jgi:hypothetical protein
LNKNIIKIKRCIKEKKSFLYLQPKDKLIFEDTKSPRWASLEPLMSPQLHQGEVLLKEMSIHKI